MENQIKQQLADLWEKRTGRKPTLGERMVLMMTWRAEFGCAYRTQAQEAPHA